jgi:hypothetical protein
MSGNTLKNQSTEPGSQGMKCGWWFAGLVALVAGWSGISLAAPAAGPASAEGLELFEREIRPLLLAECDSCHGAKLQQGGLRLTDRAALLKGGDRGPALTPGDPGRSLLLRAVRHEGALKMPPTRPLAPRQVESLERWIRLGAPWPARRAGGPVLGDQTRIFAESKRHWAYQPVRRPAPPRVKNAGWVRTPVDAFVLARLESAGLSPAPTADRRTLIRRVTYDLIGLPPSAAEVEAFVADTDPRAYDRVVERLLALPQYGERWGRHWLDVARYADTKDGVLMYGDARIRPYAYTYRDYVIRALNEDTPYDQFVREQLAADQIEPPVEPWRLAAQGFLTLGRQFDNNIHDVIDDQIDTVTRGFLGLTVSCARCHDHKYDAVPIADYYSLYGVFASSEAPVELPLITDAPPPPDFDTKYRQQKQQLEKMVADQYALLSETARQRVSDYVVHAATTAPDPLETAVFFLSLSPEDLRPQIVARWRRLLERRATPADPIFGPWSELMSGPPADMAARCETVVARWRQRNPGANPLVAEALLAARPGDRAALARVYGDLLKRVYEESKATPAPSPTPARQELLQLVSGPESPCFFPRVHTYYYMNRAEKDAYGGMRNGLDVLAVQNPGAPPRAMLLRDNSELYEPRVFQRGNPASPGDRVPRQFLKLLAGPARRPFPRGSGRLDLAEAIVHPQNPLTPRVLVNRVWMHHLGEPLVASPSDFGSRSSPPTHPELLDWLAAELRDPTYRVSAAPGSPARLWSLKHLHRVIVLSNTYRQASADRQASRKRDPENRLLWRANRRRLDFEQMRDTLLAVSGELEARMFGRPDRDALDPASRRRTVYALVDRQSLPEVFRAFNFAQPDQSIERRPNTTVPQQALFGLNSPFVAARARALAARPEVAGAPEPTGRVRALYRAVLAREPADAELAAGLSFLTTPASTGVPSQLSPLERYAQVLLQTNEVMFLD